MRTPTEPHARGGLRVLSCRESCAAAAGLRPRGPCGLQGSLHGVTQHRKGGREPTSPLHFVLEKAAFRITCGELSGAAATALPLPFRRLSTPEPAFRAVHSGC
jgi:hypothetical protein